MEQILAIDASGLKLRALVIAVADGQLKIIEDHISESDNLLAAQFVKLSRHHSNGHVAQDEAASQETPPEPSRADVSAQLSELLGKVELSWETALFLIPEIDCMSLNLSLPFENPRSIQKILDLEVQDIVPFDVGEFLLQPKLVSKLDEHSFDVHVSAVPEETIRFLIEVCRENNLEPYVVSTRASVLGAVFQLAANYISADSAVVFATPEHCCVSIAFDGRVRLERLLDSPYRERISQQSDKQITTDLKLTLAAAEQRYNRSVAKVYLIGNRFISNELQNQLGRDVEALSLTELVKDAESDDQIAALGAQFAQIENPGSLLTNFRTRKYAYNPHSKEIVKALKSVAPFAGLALVALIALLIGSYLVGYYQINSIRSALSDKIHQSMPDIEITPGQELRALQLAHSKLRQELEGLGSLSQVTPLDRFLAVSNDFPQIPGVEVSKIKIDDLKLEIEGDVPDYAAAEKIERAFKAKPKVYCEVDSAAQSVIGTQNSRRFELDITLCEDNG